MKLKTTSLIFICGLLSACETANRIEVIAGEDTITPLHQDGKRKGRFHNLYPGKKTYPTTCEADCYPMSPKLQCETGSENCQYADEQVALH